MSPILPNVIAFIFYNTRALFRKETYGRTLPSSWRWRGESESGSELGKEGVREMAKAKTGAI